MKIEEDCNVIIKLERGEALVLFSALNEVKQKSTEVGYDNLIFLDRIIEDLSEVIKKTNRG